MESNRSVKQIAKNLGEYISGVSAQIDDRDELQYYLCGSLATMLLLNATSIECCDMRENFVVNMKEKKNIPQEAKEELSLFARPIHDLDVINVSGNMVRNSFINIDGRMKNRMSKPIVQRAIPDIEQLFGGQGALVNAFHSIDSLEEGRTITRHRVAKITMEENTGIYIAAPESLIAHKLEETIALYSQKKDLTKYNLNKYEKDIKDLSTMIGGISKIYDKKELAQGILDTIKEKKESHYEGCKSELDDIFANIINDIDTYISETGLQDKLNLSDIREVLESMRTIEKDQNVRENDTKATLVASAIEVTEGKTRASVINKKANEIREEIEKSKITKRDEENKGIGE